MSRIYLDNNATTPLLPQVLEAMLPYLGPEFGNASSVHREGRAARRALESAREKIAQLLDAEPSQVIFTSGGTEANGLAILGLAGQPPGHLVTSVIEHPSVLGCFDSLGQRGFDVIRVPVDSAGLVSVREFADSLRTDTRLASVMVANNETGAVQEVGELAKVAYARGVPFHTDAVQAVGRLPISFRRLGVTTLALSAHKFHGPLGIGALLVSRNELLRPLLAGGHQEMGVRPGTEPVALAVGMAKALELAISNLLQDVDRVSRLRDRLEHGLRARGCVLTVNGPQERRLSNTLNVSFPGIDAQPIVIALDLAGVACSTGSACASGSPEPSHVLLAMGQSPAEARCSIRFSLSAVTTAAEVERAIQLIEEVIARAHQACVAERPDVPSESFTESTGFARIPTLNERG